MKKTGLLFAVATTAVFAVPVNAQVLNFEGIAISYPSSTYPFINSFYNGGTSSDGTTGVNYGITFSGNAREACLNTVFTCVSSNVSRGGLGDPSSQQGGLVFVGGTLAGQATFINRSAGFTNGFSFFYTAVISVGSFTVWSGLSGTGSNLGTLALSFTPNGPCPGFVGSFCPFVATGLAFAGTAQSVTFAGALDAMVFDDVTFGNAIPGTPPNTTVPEPASLALMAAGLATVAVAARRRKR